MPLFSRSPKPSPKPSPGSSPRLSPKLFSKLSPKSSPKLSPQKASEFPRTSSLFPLPLTFSNGSSQSMLINPLDHGAIYEKQDQISHLLEAGNIDEAMILKPDVEQNIATYAKFIFAEKVRRMKVAIEIMDQGIRLFKHGSPPSDNVFDGWEMLCTRALHADMNMENIPHDLLCPESQYLRLTKTIRGKSQELREAYLARTDGLHVDRAVFYHKFYRTFAFPTCMQDRVFGAKEIENMDIIPKRFLEMHYYSEETHSLEPGKNQDGKNKGTGSYFACNRNGNITNISRGRAPKTPMRFIDQKVCISKEWKRGCDGGGVDANDGWVDARRDEELDIDYGSDELF